MASIMLAFFFLTLQIFSTLMMMTFPPCTCWLRRVRAAKISDMFAKMRMKSSKQSARQSQCQDVFAHVQYCVFNGVIWKTNLGLALAAAASSMTLTIFTTADLMRVLPVVFYQWFALLRDRVWNHLALFTFTLYFTFPCRSRKCSLSFVGATLDWFNMALESWSEDNDHIFT